MSKHTTKQAELDLKRYAKSLRTGDYVTGLNIETAWGLNGYPPEIVSNVLSCVATGLALDAAIYEATGE